MSSPSAHASSAHATTHNAPHTAEHVSAPVTKEAPISIKESPVVAAPHATIMQKAPSTEPFSEAPSAQEFNWWIVAIPAVVFLAAAFFVGKKNTTSFATGASTTSGSSSSTGSSSFSGNAGNL